MKKRSLRVGEWVEVRSKDEILTTLDQEGRLDGMPFMPEMFAFCGKRFQIHKSAHKTCDTVFPVRSRRIDNTVHLQTRCDGQAHGDCQAGCLLFWKEAWLKRVEHNAAEDPRSGTKPSVDMRASSQVLQPQADGGAICNEETVLRATRARDDTDDRDPTYVCQATRLPYATKPLSPFQLGQYFQDYTSGNVRLTQWLRGVLYISYRNLINLGIGWGGALRWLYDRAQKIWGGYPYPRREGKIPMGELTPTEHLNLQEGEVVRVKSFQQILATCNVDNKNRGLFFDAEQVPYCGGTYRVHRRVTKILNEQTGKMMQMKNPCIILEGVVCQGRYSDCRMFCPRAIFSYWREIWLERVHSTDSAVRSVDRNRA